jgi:hypothetical protein
MSIIISEALPGCWRVATGLAGLMDSSWDIEAVEAK